MMNGGISARGSGTSGALARQKHIATPYAGPETGAPFRGAESGSTKYACDMRAVPLAWIRLATAGCSLILGAGPASQTAVADDVSANPSSNDVTNVLQISRLSSSDLKISHSFHLEGTVWWANTQQGRFVLKDESGAAELEMDLAGQGVQLGQRVRLEGNGTIVRRAAGFRIGARGAVVDNNGIHGMEEKSGAVYLKAGRHPIRVDWFNGVEKYGLEVDYEGAGLPRQKIPDAALFRMQKDSILGTSNWVNGLDYRCYEVPGEVLTDFSQQPAIKSGTTTNFDLSVMARPEHVGIQFTGCLEVAAGWPLHFLHHVGRRQPVVCGRPIPAVGSDWAGGAARAEADCHRPDVARGGRWAMGGGGGESDVCERAAGRGETGVERRGGPDAGGDCRRLTVARGRAFEQPDTRGGILPERRHRRRPKGSRGIIGAGRQGDRAAGDAPGGNGKHEHQRGRVAGTDHGQRSAPVETGGSAARIPGQNAGRGHLRASRSARPS